MARVLVAEPRGYCAGVERAIRAVVDALRRYGPPVYVKHAVVHNRHVVEMLERMGAVTVEHPDEAPEGAVVVFSAHGSPPSDYEAAARRRQHVVDATCPLVRKVHNEAVRYFREGYSILYVGHPEHVEVRGAAGYAPMTIIDERDPESLARAYDSVRGDRVVVLTQTTLSAEDVQKVVEAVRARYPGAVIRNDICYAVTNRQRAVKELVRRGAEVVLVVGSHHSSNANRMVEVARAAGADAHLVEHAGRIPWNALAERTCVGLTSGASTPEDVFWEVANEVCRRLGDNLEVVSVTREDVHFKPVEVSTEP